MSAPNPWIAHVFAFPGMMAGVFYYLWYKKRVAQRNDSGLRVSTRFSFQLFVGIAGGCAIAMTCGVILFALTDIGLSSHFDPGGLLFKAFALSITPAVIEELFFRGFLMQVFLRLFNDKFFFALIVHGIIFGISHFAASSFDGWPFFLMTALAGIILGLVNSVAGSLAVSMGIHFGWNFLGYLMFGVHHRATGEISGFFIGYVEHYVFRYISISLFLGIIFIWIYFYLKNEGRKKNERAVGIKV